jgi:single-strand DNA-binding protein
MKSLTIAGRLTRDAEIREAGAEKVAAFSVAVDDRAGKEKTTLFFDCSLWGKRGTALAPYLTKGSSVCVSGDLGTREHNGKTYLTLRAENVTLQGGKGGGGGSDGQPPPERSGRAAPAYDDAADIPFIVRGAL